MNIKNNRNCKITINDEGIAVSEKEKTADEMFEKLGYKIFNETYNFIEYQKKSDDCSKFIRFDLLDKTFTSFYYVAIDRQSYITMQELQAINKKCRELGWID